MGQFEIPDTYPNAEAKLQGLDFQAVIIARSEALSARLEEFVATYVTPERLDYDIDGITHTYDQRRISALGRAGTLLHARLHEYPLSDDPSAHNLVVIDSIDTAALATLQTAKTVEQPYASTETVLDLPYVKRVDSEPRPMPDGVTEAEWMEELELEYILGHKAQHATTPQIRISDSGWTLRHSNGMLEPLHDIQGVQRHISLALSRGLGRAAAAPIDVPTTNELQLTGSTGN